MHSYPVAGRENFPANLIETIAEPLLHEKKLNDSD